MGRGFEAINELGSMLCSEIPNKIKQTHSTLPKLSAYLNNKHSRFMGNIALGSITQKILSQGVCDEGLHIDSGKLEMLVSEFGAKQEFESGINVIMKEGTKQSLELLSLRGEVSPTTSLRGTEGDEAISGGLEQNLTRLPRSQELPRNDGVPQKFEFQEITPNNYLTFNTNIFKGKEWRDELDLKEVLRSLSSLNKQQELAKSGAHDERIEQLAHDVSSNVGNRMRGMVRSGVITPMTSHVVSNAPNN